MSRHITATTGAFMALPLAAVVLSGWSPDAGQSRIAGTFTARYAEQHPLQVPDAEGHAVVLGRVQGVNRSTGPAPYMEQGDVTSIEFADLTRGNGPQQGYIWMSQGADTVVSRWTGKVTTTLSPEKTPITSFAGTWTKVNGTGRYQRVSGKGTYRGRFTSPTEYTVDWQGEISGGPCGNAVSSAPQAQEMV